ncbi:hypothetical protein LWI28_012728 [Acer negundo]|uniref:MaoC-like domain-containing protein n=1 Tax=Acer negundo TaxID=4023 RepID=A0AAD5JD97_ACENE|nr:hypothetical protein LWI28_012728 [Acer negundo]
MLFKNLISSKPHLLRWFSTLEPPRVLRTGDVLRQRRVYSSEDIVEYSKVSHDSNPLHFDAESAKMPVSRIGLFMGCLLLHYILGSSPPIFLELYMFPKACISGPRENKKRYIVKFSTKCVKNDSKILVLDGEAMAILPTLAMEQVECYI